MKRKQKLSFSIPPSYNGLRFFAELAEELLFYFSHDSFKVPTLNFHFLCFEALDVIDKIEAGLLEKGNIIPIVQEFVRSYKDDPIIVEFYGDDINNLFLTKNAEGQYRTVLKELMQSPTSDSSIQRLKKCVLFLRDDLGRKSRYYNSGISKIESLIVKQNISHSEMEQLQKYTKIILTELIMEVLIPIEKSGSSSKINQISNSAATILSSNYIRTLIVQLDAQIKGKIPDEYEKLMSDIVGTDNAEKLLLILVLSDYSDKFDSLMEQLNSTQLLMFRIQQYKNILSFGHSVKEFYERHAKRVAWQIMRIYRNRNMIVHDGSTLPFLSVILQNLHYYIDTIIDTFCSMNDKRFQDANSIIMKLMLNEQVYLSRLDTTKTFSRDNAIPYLFGYILDES